MDRMMRRKELEFIRMKNMTEGGGEGGGGMRHGNHGESGGMDSAESHMSGMMQSYFFLATEVDHLIVDKWTGDPILDFVITVIGCVLLAFTWQGLSRLTRVANYKLSYYGALEAQLALRERRQRHEGRNAPLAESGNNSKRPAYLYHNGHVFHQAADYTELLDQHQERQRNLDTSVSAQMQRLQQRNASLLEAHDASASATALDDTAGEEDVFLDSPNATAMTELGSPSSAPRPARLSHGDRERTKSSGSRHSRNLSIDLDPNRWNSLQRNKKGYIGNHSRAGLKCYRISYHAALSLIHTLQFAIGYILMLVVMTYNAWFLVAVVGGTTVGYFLFSADLFALAARSESIVLNRRIRRQRLENIRPQTFYHMT